MHVFLWVLCLGWILTLCPQEKWELGLFLQSQLKPRSVLGTWSRRVGELRFCLELSNLSLILWQSLQRDKANGKHTVTRGHGSLYFDAGRNSHHLIIRDLHVGIWRWNHSHFGLFGLPHPEKQNYWQWLRSIKCLLCLRAGSCRLSHLQNDCARWILFTLFHWWRGGSPRCCKVALFLLLFKSAISGFNWSLTDGSPRWGVSCILKELGKELTFCQDM